MVVPVVDLPELAIDYKFPKLDSSNKTGDPNIHIDHNEWIMIKALIIFLTILAIWNIKFNNFFIYLLWFLTYS